MALRPLAFGVRKRGADRTLVLRSDSGRRTRLEIRRRGRSESREHASLASALADLARCWRNRLH